MEENYLSPMDVAKRYNVSKSTVTKLIREGKLRAIRFGGVWRVPESALQEFLQESKKGRDK